MNKKTEDFESELYDTDIADDDYGLVFSADGELKTVFLPDMLPEVLPENIQKTLDALGIDIHSLDKPQTLH